MFYNLLYPLKDVFFVFNVFRYITFRAVMAAITTFLLSVVFGNLAIKFLRRFNVKERVCNRPGCDVLDRMRGYKEGTPTMGGILIVGSVVFSTLLWTDLSNRYVLMSLMVFIGLAAVGFVDDYLKLRTCRGNGLSIAMKFTGQFIVSLIVALMLYMDPAVTPNLHIPFLKEVAIPLGILYIPFVVFVICGSSNAVNFTDGLDGLAIGCTIFTALTFSILCYVSGHLKFSDYLLIPFMPYAGELTIICAAIAGACMGFLWFNCFPATVFMGDVGSLAIGGLIGCVSVLIKKEALLFIVGGIFVVEALSVIIQILSFRLRGKRVFKMAPLHHHLQLRGVPESKIIVRFWIIASLLSLFSLLTLKIR